MESNNNRVHIIDVTRNNDTSSTSPNDDQVPTVDLPQHEDRPPASINAPTYQAASSSSNRLNSRHSSFIRRGDGYNRRRGSRLTSDQLLMSVEVELVITVIQIVASVIVLPLSTNENPQAPLFAWVVVYASGSVATLPILYWRFRNLKYLKRIVEQQSSQSHQGSSESNPPDPMSSTAISITQVSEEENNRSSESVTTNLQVSGPLSARLKRLVYHFSMALDCFFAVWFVVGIVWIFGGHSSPSDAPKLYRLCIVFLTWSFILYVLPFVLCATICCCLTCFIISFLGFRGDISQSRVAAVDHG